VSPPSPMSKQFQFKLVLLGELAVSSPGPPLTTPTGESAVGKSR
jgi:hypothetical protein